MVATRSSQMAAGSHPLATPLPSLLQLFRPKGPQRGSNPRPPGSGAGARPMSQKPENPGRENGPPSHPQLSPLGHPSATLPAETAAAGLEPSTSRVGGRGSTHEPKSGKSREGEWTPQPPPTEPPGHPSVPLANPQPPFLQLFHAFYVINILKIEI